MSDLLPHLKSGLADRYSVQRELGAGGMAIVFAAHDLRHDRAVAIKVLRPEIGTALGAERFLREIRTCAKLFHPHILTILDSGEAGGLLYYVMPLLSGESLRDRLAHGHLPLLDALKIAHECCDALAFAHSQGVVHRDIKPENILFEAGHAIVADFGIARALDASAGDRITTLGIALGTPAYMSPEQAAGEPTVDGRSDIYSMAMVVFEMLAGRTAFQGTSAEVMAKQVTEQPPALTSIVPDVPERVSSAVSRALAKNPNDRFATATEFAAELSSRQSDYLPKRGVPWIWVGVATAILFTAATVRYSLQDGIRRAPVGHEGGVASALNRKLEQVTFAEGVEQWPVWSPDGKSLAYVAEVGGRRKVFIRDLATGADQQITTGAADDIQPSWSPDGSQLVFVRARSTSARLEPADVNGIYQEAADVWQVSVKSRAERRVVENAFNPRFSRDGRQLAFDANWSGSQRIWISDSQGRNPRQITNDSTEAVIHTEPDWSKDGKKVVFRRLEKTISDIAIVDVATQKTTWVTNDNVLDMNPVWAPDNTAIYYSSAAGGGINIWRIRVREDGSREGEPEQVTTGAGDDINPAVSPTATGIAFALRSVDSDLWQLPIDAATGKATGAPKVVTATTRVESRGSWSPDGRTIAFNSDRRREMNIWLKTLGVEGDRQLTSGAGGDYQANWSPDGKSLVFFSARSGNADIWRVDVATGKLTQLTTDRAVDTNPFYSPDGKQIAFMTDRSGRLQVWVMPADGSNQRAVSDVRAGGHFIRWTADGRHVVFRAESGTQFQTMKLRVTDGAAERLRDVASGAHMSWSPNHDLVLDVKSHKTLMVYPLAGEPITVFQFPESQVRIDYPVWSPDGKWVLFDRAAPRGGDIWMLTGR